MKVFISWSGDLSHSMAQALADWIPNVIQAAKPFLSSEAIHKGARWFEQIGAQLEETHFGILCLTRSNLSAPWILFEAGALSKQLEVARVAPLLIDLKPADLMPPLSQFNAVVAPTKPELEKLLKAINEALGDNKLSDAQFAKAFTREWSDMEAKIEEVRTLGAAAASEKPAIKRRTVEEMVEEILALTRSLVRGGDADEVTLLARRVSEYLHQPFAHGVRARASEQAKRGIVLPGMNPPPPRGPRNP